MKLIHVPIELLKERYSHQWYHWFNKEFTKFNIDVVNVLPTSGLNAKIATGEFLDVIGTLEFKTEQLNWICSLFREHTIDKDTVFLFADAWFPGIELLAYLRNALQIPFKMVGIFHAGTWDQHDFITKKGMRSWGQYCERAWFEILDRICVATDFHKKLILKSISNYSDFSEYEQISDKIIVTSLPIYPDFVEAMVKKNIVVFPHRLAEEKNPHLFDQLQRQLQPEFPQWEFIKTKELCKTKTEYYNILNQAKISVSFADQETYGISMLESVLCGCVPIVPNRLSYKELYPKQFKYTQLSHVVDLLSYMMTNQDFFVEKTNLLRHKVQYDGEHAIFNILKCCLEVCDE